MLLFEACRRSVVRFFFTCYFLLYLPSFLLLCVHSAPCRGKKQLFNKRIGSILLFFFFEGMNFCLTDAFSLFESPLHPSVLLLF